MEQVIGILTAVFRSSKHPNYTSQISHPVSVQSTLLYGAETWTLRAVTNYLQIARIFGEEPQENKRKFRNYIVKSIRGLREEYIKLEKIGYDG
jgi:hypothetical protein